MSNSDIHAFQNFEWSHKVMEPKKDFYYADGEGAVDHSVVTRCFKNFRSAYKNLNEQD